MNPESSYASLTCRLKLHQRRRDNLTAENATNCPTGFDVAQLFPPRPFPDWVKHRPKRAKLSLHSKSIGDAKRGDTSSLNKRPMTLDLNNMQKDWKSRSTRRSESLQRARVMQNRRSEAVKDFPGDVRPLAIPPDSPVAIYAITNGRSSRKRFGSPAAAPEPNNTNQNSALCGDSESSQEAAHLPLMDKTYLALDQSKLPLEVNEARIFCRTIMLMLFTSTPRPHASSKKLLDTS